MSRRGGRGSPAIGKWVKKGESPVTVDRSLNESSSGNRGRGNESSGNRGSGFQGRGRGRTSSSPRTSSEYANDEPIPMLDNNSSQVSNVDGIVSTKKPDEISASKSSGCDNKDHLQSPASSNSKSLNLSGCENKDVSRTPCDPLNRIRDVLFSCQESIRNQKVMNSSVKDHDSGNKSSGYDNKDHLQSPASNSKSLNFSGCENKDVARTPCDSMNKKGDVSLSCQESTRDQKVVNFSVKDHDSGNKSLNESRMRPFDLFLRRKGMGLIPSLKDLNREKRKATEGYIGNVIRSGMVLLRNYLSIDDQVMIVNKCRQLGLGEGGFYQPGYSDGAKLRLQMMCLGKDWNPETSKYGATRLIDGSVPPQIPVEFSQIVLKAIKDSQSLVAKESKIMNGEDEIPSMSPDLCIVNFYTSTGRLGLHQDKDESKYSIRKGLPVVSFSIGDSAEFLYSDYRDDERAKMVVLESGDVLLFGGESRGVFHGVRSICKDTAPKVLVYETGLRPGRLNLTFRKY